MLAVGVMMVGEVAIVINEEVGDPLKVVVELMEKGTGDRSDLEGGLVAQKMVVVDAADVIGVVGGELEDLEWKLVEKAGGGTGDSGASGDTAAEVP